MKGRVVPEGEHHRVVEGERLRFGQPLRIDDFVHARRRRRLGVIAEAALHHPVHLRLASVRGHRVTSAEEEASAQERR